MEILLKLKMLRRGISILGAVMVLGGCAANRSVVLPRSDGAYEIIATSSSEIGAYQRADLQAEKTCKKQKKQYRVHDRQTRYLGSLSAQAVRLNRSLSSPISSAASVKKLPAASEEDYKVTILVTCV